MTEPTKGFVIVASKKHNFYLYALNLCESIRDYYEDAKICLVTEERFLDGRENVADDVVLCDDHYRAKIYGMAKSPYVYLCKNKFSIFYSGFRYSRHYHSVYYNESITHISSDTEPTVRKKRAL